MEILENLYYGDIQLLDRLKRESKPAHAEKSYFQETLNDQELYHIEILEKEHLVRVERGATPYQITVRSLAIKLLKFIAE